MCPRFLSLLTQPPANPNVLLLDLLLVFIQRRSQVVIYSGEGGGVKDKHTSGI